jgi:CTP:molybdopterin cytidylyltransferase MocA
MGNDISAILLAAGLSSRMGRPKLLLPWGKTTVLGQVVATFARAGIEDIVVVTGGAREQVEELVVILAKDFPVRSLYNPQHIQGGNAELYSSRIGELRLQDQCGTDRPGRPTSSAG